MSGGNGGRTDARDGVIVNLIVRGFLLLPDFYLRIRAFAASFQLRTLSRKPCLRSPKDSSLMLKTPPLLYAGVVTSLTRARRSRFSASGPHLLVYSVARPADISSDATWIQSERDERCFLSSDGPPFGTSGVDKDM